MEYREIVAVTGLGGLYQLMATKSDGAIVRNLTDQSTKFISARTHNVTPLESIEIYTTSENVRLHEVLAVMQEQEAATPVPASKSGNNEIKAYFQTVYPHLDEDRVYVSDMKKILKWYTLLKENDLLRFEKVTEEATTEETPATEAVSKNDEVQAVITETVIPEAETPEAEHGKMDAEENTEK